MRDEFPTEGSEEDILTKLAKASAENVRRQREVQDQFSHSVGQKFREDIDPNFVGPKSPPLSELPATKAYMNEVISPMVTMGSINKAAGLIKGSAPSETAKDFFTMVKERALAEGKDIGKTGAQRRDEAFAASEQLAPKAITYSEEKLAALKQKLNDIFKSPTMEYEHKLDAARKVDKYERMLRTRKLMGE